MKKRLRELKLSFIENRKLRGQLIVFQVINNFDIKLENLFERASNNNIKANRHKLKLKSF